MVRRQARHQSAGQLHSSRKGRLPVNPLATFVLGQAGNHEHNSAVPNRWRRSLHPPAPCKKDCRHVDCKGHGDETCHPHHGQRCKNRNRSVFSPDRVETTKPDNRVNQKRCAERKAGQSKSSQGRQRDHDYSKNSQTGNRPGEQPNRQLYEQARPYVWHRSV